MIIELLTGCTLLASHGDAPCRCTTPDLASLAVVRVYTDSTHAAFVGRAIAAHSVEDTIAFAVNAVDGKFVRGDAIMADFVEFTVVTSVSWGARPLDTVVVRTPAQPTMCGADIALNQPYLFLAGFRSKLARVDHYVPPLPVAVAGDVMQLLDQATARRRPR